MYTSDSHAVHAARKCRTNAHITATMPPICALGCSYALAKVLHLSLSDVQVSVGAPVVPSSCSGSSLCPPPPPSPQPPEPTEANPAEPPPRPACGGTSDGIAMRRQAEATAAATYDGRG